MPKTILVSISPITKKPSQKEKHVQHLMMLAGLKEIACKKVETLYRLEGDLTVQDAERIAQELLRDPVVEKFQLDAQPQDNKTLFADIWYKPGVTDPAAESVLKAIRDLGVSTVTKTSVGMRCEFVVKGTVNGSIEKNLLDFADKQLLNPLVQECKLLKV